MTPRGAAALAAVGVVLAGCGGGSSGPTKADYIARADKICRQARSAALPLVKQVTAGGFSLSPSEAKKLAGVASQLHTVEARYLAQLQALEQPSADKKAIAAFLTPAASVVKAIDSAAAALQRGDLVTTLGLLNEAQSAGSEAKTAADAYGFKDCGSALALAG